MGRTLAQKIWDARVVHRAQNEPDLLYIDLHMLYEVTSVRAFEGLRAAGRGVRRPDLTLAVEDHTVPTVDILKPIADLDSREQVRVLRANCAEFGVELYSLGDDRQGIVHVIAPEQGFTHPGMTIVCCDSHTTTQGAFGALAYGIGTTQAEQVLATQTLLLQPMDNMAITVHGELPPGVTGKDLNDRVVRTSGPTCAFELDDYTRWRLLNGLDDTALALTRGDAIEAYERDRRSALPRTAPVNAS